MKKNLLSIFALFLILLPLTGCGNDKVNFNFSLAKQDSSGSSADFTLNDCAEISGGGQYKKGDSVTLIVKYVDAACKFAGFRVEETKQLLSSGIVSNVEGTNGVIKQIKYTFNNVQESRTIKAIMVGKGETALKRGAYFQGVGKITEKNGGITYLTNYKFPLNSVGPGDQDKLYIPSDYDYDPGNLPSVLSNGKELDLNYIYLNESGVDKFVPHKLNWTEGVYTVDDNGDELCNYSSKVDISDPNTYEVPQDKMICLRATYETYEDDSMQSFKNKAINNMLLSEVKVAIDDVDACGNGGSNVTIGDNCFYVKNLKNLYNSKLTESSSVEDKKNALSMYYGKDNTGKQEAVFTDTQTGAKYYHICVSETECSSVNGESDKVIYPIDSYSWLGDSIEKLIEALGKQADDTHAINLDKITFEYSRIIRDVVVSTVKVGTKTYYFHYTDKGCNFPGTLSNALEHDKYKITFANTLPSTPNGEQIALDNAIKSLKEIIDSKIVNSLFPQNNIDDDTINNIHNKIISLIDADINDKKKDSKLHILKDYIFSINKNGFDISITATQKKLSQTIVDKINFAYMNIKDGKVEKVCVYDHDTLTYVDECSKYSEKRDYIQQLVERLINSNLREYDAEGKPLYTGVKITTEDSVTQYEFKDVKKDTVIVISVSENKIEFYIGEELYTLIQVPEFSTLAQEKIKSIKLETYTVLGTIVQTFDGQTVDTKMYDRNDNDITDRLSSFTIDDEDIKNAYNLLKAGRVYKINDLYGYVLVSGAKIYTVKKVDTKYEFTYSRLSFEIGL